jgi:3-oxoacyl-[acyl-carrier protein] reductase
MKRHVIVTGGSRGIGAAIVSDLLADGYRVSICSRTRTDFVDRIEQDPRFSDCFYWAACSVGKSEDVATFVGDAVRRAGEDALYGLINNAGVAQAGILATFPDIESERILQTNLLGAIQMARAFCRYMVKAENGGRIINISSIIGVRGYNGMAAYSASKAGLDGLTRALARELGRRQITVNSVAPGYVETEMSSSLSPAQLAQIVNRTPLGRLATEHDVGAVVRFLLSDAGSFITGQTILVDGGISC